MLDQGTNRGYKNKPFLEKRRILGKVEQNGQFVPLTTRNVFLKAYTANPSEWELWNDEDKNDYLQAIADVLESYRARHSLPPLPIAAHSDSAASKLDSGLTTTSAGAI